jgi:ABC-2 type transport system permease protein
MNLRRLWAVARKEALHIRRDPRSLGLALGIPMMMLLMFGYALTLDVDRVPFVVWDQSGTALSRELLARFAASRYFDFQGAVGNYQMIERAIDRREADLGMIIPPEFARQIEAGRPASVQAIVDGSDSNTASIILGYTQGVVSGLNNDVMLAQVRRIAGAAPSAALDLRSRIWFNPDLESKYFIVPGIMAVIMGLIAALLTSLTIAREWERGTMEQLISTPVRPAELILGKLLPYLGIGMLDMVIAVLMAVFLFHVPLRGSILLLFSVGGVFVFGTLAQGILISTLARSQLLASQFAMISTFLPAFLLSGFAFAIGNMPTAVQVITYIIPARYFVALVKGIFLRGVGIGTLWPDIVFLIGFALAVSGASIVLTAKKLR